MTCASKILIKFEKPEIERITAAFGAFGIEKKFDTVLRESHLVIEGGETEKNRESEGRRLLKVFHPSMYFVLRLKPGEKENTFVMESEVSGIVSPALRGLVELTGKRGEEIIQKTFSDKVFKKAKKQNNLALKCYADGWRLKLRTLFKKKFPNSRLVDDYHLKKLNNAAKTLEKTNIFKEIEGKLSEYLKSGSSNRSLIKPNQIIFTPH